jgi:hypothetical protein
MPPSLGVKTIVLGTGKFIEGYKEDQVMGIGQSEP